MRGIVFDLFHTLVDPEDFRPRAAWRLRLVAEAMGDVNVRELIMFWKDTYEERMTSPVSGTGIILRYAAENGIDLTARQEAEITGHLGDYQDVALGQPRPDILAAVAALATTYPLVILSNCYVEEVAAWPGSPLAPHFAGAAFSFAIGARKPDVEAYDAATALLGLEPGDCAFVGNGGSSELLGAKQVGFALVVHQNQFNQADGLVSDRDQRRRAALADAQITSLAQLEPLLG